MVTVRINDSIEAMNVIEIERCSFRAYWTWYPNEVWRRPAVSSVMVTEEPQDGNEMENSFQ